MSTTSIRESHQTPVTLPLLRRMKEAGEKIVCLTAYDASFTVQIEQAGVEV
ncbi:MAG: 3-methyl-2-oxobutanoate hydroxymethyltransferase, partial [Anaerolineae bacterium]|nr:3-methyl-2-oxobutanoate hydroxymethyltransferase [Anaerolineae bacterium]